MTEGTVTHWAELAEVARDNRADESKAEGLSAAFSWLWYSFLPLVPRGTTSTVHLAILLPTRPPWFPNLVLVNPLKSLLSWLYTRLYFFFFR